MIDFQCFENITEVNVLQIEFHFILVACRDESVRLYELVFPVDVDVAQFNALVADIDFCLFDLPCRVVYEELGGVDINAGGYAVGCGLFHQCRQADFSGEFLFPVVVPGNVGVQSVVGSVTVKDKGDVTVLVVKLCCSSHCAQVADAVDVDGKKYEAKNKEAADKIVKASQEGTWSVDKVKRVNSQSKPQPPFTTSTMQQDASGKLSLTAPQVMQLAQQLYEGVELGAEGQVALVTYIRTDSVRISDDAQREALSYISNTYGADYCPKKPNVYVTKKGAQDAHEAIRPISLERTPESIKDKVPRNIYKLYKLIYDRFVASQMANAVYDTLNVHINSLNPNGHTCGYTLKGRTLVFKGYLAAYTPVSDGEEEKDSKTLPDFKEGQPLTLKEMQSEQKFTKPPLRYTDSTLVKAMEENGIGRPSTYAATITVLAKRKYTDKDGKYILPTELGELACDCLSKYFPYIMDVNFTSNMESDLDKIEDGSTEWQSVIADFYPGFHERVLKARGDNAGKVKPKEEVSDVICEKCGAKMVVKEGRYGKFLACPNYPKCKNIKPIGEPVAKCPKCGGDVFKRISKKGKAYFACANYPECDFYSWDIPAPILCPECGSYMKMYKDKAGNIKYVCAGKECKHTEMIPAKPEDGNED